MTLTQNGASVTGMPSPSTFEAGNGVIVAESGIISGTIAGEHVTLALTDRITVNGMGPRRDLHGESRVHGRARRQHAVGHDARSNHSTDVRQRR